MRVSNSPNSASLPARCLAAALAALLAVSPLAGQNGSSASTPAGSAGTQAKTAAATGTKKSTKAKSKSPAAKSGKSKSQAGQAARAARTARIHQAFVASTELRPMAQQLATLRTPAAYAGVAKYAHAHTGEASSAAYLALGHAYLADQRFQEASENLRQAQIRFGHIALDRAIQGGGGLGAIAEVGDHGRLQREQRAEAGIFDVWPQG